MMTKDEWALELIKKLASGHMNGIVRAEASSYLKGDNPPENWEPKAKRNFESKCKNE